MMEEIRIYLYYKDRKQLKTFVIQIGPAITLTLDPHVGLKGVGGGGDP